MACSWKERPTYSEIDAEDVRVAPGYLENTGHTLAEQLWRVHVLQDGLQVAHHQLEQSETLSTSDTRKARKSHVSVDQSFPTTVLRPHEEMSEIMSGVP